MLQTIKDLSIADLTALHTKQSKKLFILNYLI